MGSCFSGKKHQDPDDKKNRPKEKSRVQDIDRAKGELKVTKVEVQRYIRKLESNIAACHQAARSCVQKKDKSKALLALRKRKYLQKQIETAQAQLLNIEQMITDVESAEMQKNVFDALQQGTDFLKNINEQLTIQDVEKLMDDYQEALDYQDEISRALAGQGIEEDDEEILKQLDELDQLDALDVEIPNAPRNQLPVHQPPVKRQREEFVNA